MAGAEVETEDRRTSAELQTPRRPRRVAYFVDIFAAYNDPLIGVATVEVLRHNGVEVYVPPRQVGCGMAALAVGDVETPASMPLRNVRVLADLVREGYRIVCSEPTAALMLAQDYLDLLDDADTASVAAHTVELTTFLAELHEAGRLRTDFQPVDLTLGPSHPVPPEGSRRPNGRTPAPVAHSRTARPHHRSRLFRAWRARGG